MLLPLFLSGNFDIISLSQSLVNNFFIVSKTFFWIHMIAEKEGFEPSRRLNPTYTLSRGASSASWVFLRAWIDLSIHLWLSPLRRSYASYGVEHDYSIQIKPLCQIKIRPFQPFRNVFYGFICLPYRFRYSFIYPAYWGCNNVCHRLDFTNCNIRKEQTCNKVCSWSFPSSAMKLRQHCQSASVAGSSSDDPESSFLIESLRIMNFTDPFMSSLIPEKLS